MTTEYRIALGPETTPLEQGRSAHGRSRWGYQHATAPHAGRQTPAGLNVVHDADRLAFALASGPAAAPLAQRLTDFLWRREALNEDWPAGLRDWLNDADQWDALPPVERATGFICGRLERNLPGGRIYLAWLGMDGVRLLDRSNQDLTLDIAIGADEGWTPAGGIRPDDHTLHAYRGSLFGLERLLVLTPGAAPLRDDLPDMGGPDVQHALEDWATETEHDLAIFDLRLNPVLTEPNHVILHHRWITPELCLLFWQPSANATAYRIQESETPDFDTADLIAELTDGRQTQYKLSPPTAGPRYYRVIPLNQGVPGTPSDPVRPTPLVLTAPVMQPVEWDRDGGYSLHWTPIEQATGYEVQTAPTPDFDPHESEVIYRGEMAEITLPRTTEPHRYYRVRAINALYAPQSPSAWSQPRRAPARLATPHFASVTHERLEWDPVPGAQQYAVHVTAQGADEDHQGQDVLTRETAIRAADQPAVYRVRAFRRPDDKRTASDWSEPVTLAPKVAAPVAASGASRNVGPLLIAVALVALLVGTALGMGGIEAYQRARATSTRTPLPAAMVEQTQNAATAAAVDATQVRMLGTRVQQTQIAIVVATGTATAWTPTPSMTVTPSPTVTRTPSSTPNLTETIDRAFANGLTATAAGWTATPSATLTPSPTVTRTPSSTPDANSTLEAGVAAALTTTAAGWTTTPSATLTPSPTVTRTPSSTPDANGTLGAGVAAALTATAAVASPTPTSDIDATVAAYIETGCYITRLPPDDLPLYPVPLASERPLLDAVPLLAQVANQVTLGRSDEPTTWLRVRVHRPDGPLTGWVRVPPDRSVETLTGGANCP